jgi:2-haloacid dehalogenase
VVDRWASFDCYGTLIDWERGIGDALAGLWPEGDRVKLLASYHDIEPGVQAGSSLSYREVMARTLEGIAEREGLELRPVDREALAESLPAWPAFPEVGEALDDLVAGGWRVAILSNTDPDLLAASLVSIGAQPDLAITAAEAGSYKPAHGHWKVFRERSGVDPSRHVHVGASPFHDIAPAAELGIPVVWINRLHEESDLPRAAELPDLSGLRGVLDELVSGG